MCQYRKLGAQRSQTVDAERVRSYDSRTSLAQDHTPLCPPNNVKLAATSTNPFPAIAPNSSTSPSHHSALVKHLHQNQHPLPRQYPQTPKKHTSHPHHTRYTEPFVLRVDVSRFFGLAADTGGDDRRHCQDRPTRILSGPVDSGAGHTRFYRDEAEDVRIHSPFKW